MKVNNAMINNVGGQHYIAMRSLDRVACPERNLHVPMRAVILITELWRLGGGRGMMRRKCPVTNTGRHQPQIGSSRGGSSEFSNNSLAAQFYIIPYVTVPT